MHGKYCEYLLRRRTSLAAYRQRSATVPHRGAVPTKPARPVRLGHSGPINGPKFHALAYEAVRKTALLINYLNIEIIQD